MKIEIDLDQILTEEYGPSENLAESIHRQIVDRLSKDLEKGISKKIDEGISKLINETLKKEVEKITPEFLSEIINGEYVKVDQWGDRRGGKPTTFRTELIRELNENFAYKAARYDSDKNCFTRAVDEVILKECKRFQEEFNSIVNKDVVEKTLEFALKTLKEKLKLT